MEQALDDMMRAFHPDGPNHRLVDNEPEEDKQAEENK